MRQPIALCALLLAAPAAAQTTLNPPTTTHRFAWDARPAAEQVTRYEVRQGTAAWTSVGLVTWAALPALTAGSYTYEVRACNVTGCGAAGSAALTVVEPPPQLPVPGVPANRRFEPIPAVTPIPPPAGVIVKMDCQGGAAWPLCGATRTVGNDVLGTKWERSYIAAENAVELHLMAGATGEGYYGWQWTGLPNPGPGGRRVFRARIKVLSPIQWTGWGDKFYIFGDVANDSANRVIGTMEMWQGQPHLNVDKNIDGRYASVFLTPDEYVAVQMVVEPTAAGASTYNFKYYRNGALVSTSASFTINPERWTDFNVGYYGQYQNGGHVRVRFTDVSFSDSYDPNFR